MKKMTAFAASALMAATALGAAAIPATASAQVSLRFGAPGFWTPERSEAIRTQIWDLDRDVDRAAQSRAVSRGEAMRLRNDVRSLRATFQSYNRNGLDFREVRLLQDRVNRIRTRLQLKRLDWDREDYWANHRMMAELGWRLAAHLPKGKNAWDKTRFEVAIVGKQYQARVLTRS